MGNTWSQPKGQLTPPDAASRADVGQVQAIWDLCEWQLDDPARFRALLKSEEEATSWVGEVLRVVCCGG